jgi:hypothetical protein
MDPVTGNPLLDHSLWIGRMAVLVGGLVFLLKTDRFNGLLGRFGLKPVPRHYLPWLALGFGVLHAALEARLRGASWELVAASAFDGLFAGALAIAGDSAPVAAGKRLLKPSAAVAKGEAQP